MGKANNKNARTAQRTLNGQTIIKGNAMVGGFYSESMPYEWFIRRAHNLIQRQTRLGADMCFMRNLKLAEAGSSHASGLPSYEKQLETVKKHMNRALAKYQKLKMTTIEKTQLLDLVWDLDRAFTTAQLDEVIQKGLELTQRFFEK